MINKLEKHIEENLENALNDLKEFVRIPSIAAKNQGIVKAAEFLNDRLSGAGVKRKFTIHQVHLLLQAFLMLASLW